MKGHEYCCEHSYPESYTVACLILHEKKNENLTQDTK